MRQSRKLAENLIDTLIREKRLDPAIRDQAIVEAEAEILRSMRGAIGKGWIRHTAKSLSRLMIDASV
jgi:hypothetical protein